MTLILTCEHGGNDIPAPYSPYFKAAPSLQTHRGYDLGALDLFRFLKPLSHWALHSRTSRLFVELNRSPSHRQLFSEFTRPFHPTEKKHILETYYKPYRTEVLRKIEAIIASKATVLHLSIHSFTPVLDGRERHCDIGLLYDPSKTEERAFCRALKRELLQADPQLNVRFNYPYLGKADGFTTWLRSQFPVGYLGIEIEVNQTFSKHNRLDLKLKTKLYKAIEKLTTH